MEGFSLGTFLQQPKNMYMRLVGNKLKCVDELVTRLGCTLFIEGRSTRGADNGWMDRLKD